MVTPSSVPLPDRVAVRRALVSVSDKTGVAEFAGELAKRGVDILSTGGTAKTLSDAGIKVTDVAEVTGFPEVLGGRVKTLHPMIHGGLLGVRNDPQHAAQLVEHGIESIDLLVIDLYPFEKTVASGAAFRETIEQIDIGGPAMIRAAAKNHAFVAVLVDPADYSAVLDEMSAGDGTLPIAMRKRLAAKAYARTAAYDAAISTWFAGEEEQPDKTWFSLGGRLISEMRYGENPHQKAGFYGTGMPRPGVATARQVQGKALSYNNINDTDAAYELVAEFDPERTAAVAIIKHANPCGVAEGDGLVDAYRKALACDPVSAFGGIVALNRELDAEAATAITEIFTEVIIAPGATDEAIEIVAAKKNLRLLLTDGLPDPRFAGPMVRSVAGGFLVQDRDGSVVEDCELTVATARAPSEQEWADLKFAWRVAKHVKSNAIVYVKDGATVGVGAGQMSRVDSARIAARKSADAAEAAGVPEPLTRGSVVASDAFFPFADGLMAAVDAGATAVIQPGGSMRDDEVIKAADEAGIAMVFTGVRHFRH
ncbi:bifunctional phosphoribosylaminoimidazolecarboxamide formyltransferase/IMP cyclohydrolase [Amorphus orientalis]|uniref:Bifunctional purine biosynthesis protein PurH n=1 Tax=Amorphus orientalis TaxID=649198 RepID=A0AAE3VMF8_9HYPH|nr:bifunctional phosphoribosylaminoimidazolecarboxamide formyltransferase/IMP cyclohydrolase [Amorphus orientalis]MDQ0314647.1 phosphoribosylaminoimidazolecarboxamide formyltransferase/IMP cyclohydrolase [Amorphus orientalis]